MCMELILAVMIFVYDDGAGFLKKSIDMHNLENVFSSSKRQSNPVFSTFLKKNLNKFRLLLDVILKMNHEVIFYLLKAICMVQ